MSTASTASRPAGFRAARLVAAVLAALPAIARAERIITADHTQTGGIFAVNPADEVVIHGPTDPTLTLTNKATTSGVEGVVVGTSAGNGQLFINGGSILTNSGSLSVGYLDGGTLNIVAGGHVTSAWSDIGVAIGSTGQVAVTGIGATWTIDNDLAVGRSGNGTLNITAGGSVSNAEGFIGLNNAAGAVSVIGDNSTWTNSGNLRMRIGTLAISAGGQLSNTTGYIRGGSNSNTVATAFVTGIGSTWINSGGLDIGSNLKKGRAQHRERRTGSRR